MSEDHNFDKEMEEIIKEFHAILSDLDKMIEKDPELKAMRDEIYKNGD